MPPLTTAGALAGIIAAILRDQPLDDAIDDALDVLARRPQSGDVTAAIAAARREAAIGASDAGLSRLGRGFIAEEALAIALYCSLTATSVPDAIIRAVNHSGDSDSTGAIAGNILGALNGASPLPAHWLYRLELSDVIGRVATDLHDIFRSGRIDDYRERYPGW